MELIREQGPLCVPLAAGPGVRQPQSDLCPRPVPLADFCLKFSVTLPAFTSPCPLVSDWKAANWHYYRLRSRKVGCCWGFSVSRPQLHLQPAQPVSQEIIKEFSCRMESVPIAAVCLAQRRHPTQWRNKQALFKLLCYPGWPSSVQTEGIWLSNQENAW